MHNENFKPLEFDGFKNQAGANAFIMALQKWIEKANANIHDNYPKYLFTIDQMLQRRDGIYHYNLIDFIAENKEL